MTTFTPYPYQRQIASLLLHSDISQRRNIILQAPTGAGKTQAALLPFLNALDNQRDFPQRCIYSVPMRILAKQFVSTYEEAVKNAGRSKDIKVRIQTGEQPEDPEFESNLIFATIDQTLSSYLLAPYSLGRRKANVNAGAVMSSYLVFDEFHLYDPASTLPTTLLMLRHLKGITPFILMTATFSTDMLEELGELLDAQVFPATPAEREGLDRLPSQQKTRIYRIAQRPLTAQTVLDVHVKRSLVICNQVDRARRLYDDLLNLKSPETQIILLHSRFLKEERNAIEEAIQSLFGKEADRSKGSAIVVATQAIEVGVDMSCETLHTELAPANAVIQRAGRCARYKDDRGTVYIYGQTLSPDDREQIIDLNDPNNAAPYTSQKALFKATFDAFSEREGKDKFEFSDEQAIITEVHGEDDRKILRDFRADGKHEAKIFALQIGDSSVVAQHLIRDMKQQNIIIHANPDTLTSQPDVSPFDLPSFGLHPGTLQKYIRQWQERWEAMEDGPEWVVRILHDYGSQVTKDEESAAQANEERYRWLPLTHAEEARHAPLVAVHPAFATYDLKRGFVPDQGGDWETSISKTSTQKQTGAPYGYRLETYREHIQHVYTAFQNNWWEAAWAAARLEKRFKWPHGSVRRAAELAVLLHDVGKLSEDWQKWVCDYQAKIVALEDNSNLECAPGEAYAHTHLVTQAHKDIERSMRKRPWHAVEGAESTFDIVGTTLKNDDLSNAVYSAIARHHAPHSDSHQTYKLIKNARRHIAAAFPSLIPAPDLSALSEAAATSTISDYFPSPSGDRSTFLAYLLIVRALRRADVAGTQAGKDMKL